MSLFEKISSDLLSAMKAKDKVTTEALRNLKKALIEAKTAKPGELDDADALKAVSKLAKQGRDSAAIYTEQSRTDLAGEELAQVAVYEQYLPQKMSAEELQTVIRDIIFSTGATSIKDMGKVMGVASKQLAGRAEGKDISEAVKKLLS
ncbi:MAG: GatB/YqeY domain-containing protein [Bacteroidales bacterium]|jgi:uncharacterized protein YqeY|nr:GatB/YqeY domain-containing protein [Bacteroidales bacterium]